MFASIFNAYHGALLLCYTTADLIDIFWYCSWDFWSCICQSAECPVIYYG